MLARRGSGFIEVVRELVDRLLVILIGPNRRGASSLLREAGYSEDGIRGAWNFARAAGYTERTGSGMDRLTPAGRARAIEVRDGTDPR